MAISARFQPIPERLYNFQGVNLRRDRLNLRDEDVARAINCDLHAQVGTALARRGRSLLYGVSGGSARLMQTLGGTRYLVAGTTLYKAGASILTGLSSTLRTSLVLMRPLNDTLTWMFIADQAVMRKENGGTVRTWGIAAPTATPALAAGAAGTLAGPYTVSFTYVRKDGSTIAHESNPSPTSAALTVTNQQISVTGMTASTDGQVTHKRVYRTVAGGSTRLFDQEITNATTTATLSIADTALGSAVETNNNVPPASFWATRHQEHVFFLDPANPSYLWWSKRFRPESVPTVNFLDIGSTADPLNGMVSLVGVLGLFTAKTKYRVLGNDTSGFVHQEALSSRGTPAPQAALVTEKGCLFPARDGLFRTNFLQEDEELSGLIAPIFEGLTVNDYLPINWDAANTMALAYWKQRLYFAYPSGGQGSPDMVAVYSFHTQSWYFYQMFCRSLYAEEETDLLLAGTDGGDVLSLETGTTDNGTAISLELQQPTRALGNPMVRKRFDYFRADVDARGGTVNVFVYIDDRLIAFRAVIGTRTRLLLRLGGVQGYTWHPRYIYTGNEQVQVYGSEIQAVALEAA